MNVVTRSPVTSSLRRFAILTTLTPPSSSCSHHNHTHYLYRHFSSDRRTYISSHKRELQTASAYRPSVLPSDIAPPPPHNNAGIPASSIAGGIPKFIDTRPPGLPGEYNGPVSMPSPPSATKAEQHTQDRTFLGVSETEVQKSRPARRVRTFRPRKAAMTLTPTAISHLQKLLDQPSPKLIRVGVKNRGCSGLAYHLEYVEKPGKFDEVVEQDGVKVLIDSKALFSIIGSEMDWVGDKLNERFVFHNPNIKEQCGCGESFMV